ncbi:MAG: hyalin, partial [Candidatus Thiodiazotropha endolucinida]
MSADLPKVLTLSWSDQGANHYKLLKNPDGISGYTQVGSDITDNQVHDEIAVHLTDWVNMSYIVQSCSADDVCVDSSPISPIPAMLDSIGYFKASNTGRWDFFGVSVALSADGNTMAISATGDDSPATGVDGDQLGDSSGSSGAVFLFVREGTSWRQQAYIKSSNSDMEDDFGGSLALSSNGDVLAVGALSEDSAAIGVNGNQADNSAEDSGAVYLF